MDQLSIVGVVTFVLLHSVGNVVVALDPNDIVTMRDNQGKGHIAKEVGCIITTVDGKFLTVIESCDEVRKLVEDNK